jgi:hypothetical protein
MHAYSVQAFASLAGHPLKSRPTCLQVWTWGEPWGFFSLEVGLLWQYRYQ